MTVNPVIMGWYEQNITAIGPRTVIGYRNSKWNAKTDHFTNARVHIKQTVESQAGQPGRYNMFDTIVHLESR